jgi:glycosyltransferase involved in cell wall biosynthesis
MSKRPLRILSVADVHPDPNSGAAGTVYHTNAALRELGNHVDELWSDDLGPRRIRHGNLHSLLEQPLAYRRRIIRAVAAKDYDAILSQQPQSYLAARHLQKQHFAGAFITVSQGVENRLTPILLDWHRRLSVPRNRFPNSLFAPILQTLLARQWPLAAAYSDGLAVQHSDDCEFVVREYGFPADRVHIWASGLPLAFRTTPYPPFSSTRLNRILYVGQFAFYKGPHFLLRIIEGVLANNSRASMTWVCGAEDHAQIRKCLPPEIRARVTMLAWMPQRELVRVFDEHGIFIFPTIGEGFAKAALEAMSRGLCVVCSRCCGMRDYVDNDRTGFLCDVGDVETFVAVTLKLQADVALAEKVSRAAVMSSRPYSWSDSAALLADYLRRTCAAKGASRSAVARGAVATGRA